MKLTIKAIRVARDFKPKEISSILGVTTSFISHVEAGRCKMPEDCLKEFAKFTGISFIELEELIALEKNGASFQYILKKYLEMILKDVDVILSSYQGYIIPNTLKAIRVAENDSIATLSKEIGVSSSKIEFLESGISVASEEILSKYQVRYNIERSLFNKLIALEKIGKPFKEILKEYLLFEKQE